jgi:mRNA interferase RelE/StbE
MTTEPYTSELTDEAKADLERLDKATAQSIVRKLRWLVASVAVMKHYALTGGWSGLYRLRVGDYRIIYDLDHTARRVVVVAIGHRREVYKT